MRDYESVSSLKLYEGCPRCYWLKYVAGLENGETPAQRIGKDTHEAIKLYHSGGKFNSESEIVNKLIEVYKQNVSVDACNNTEHEFFIPIINIATEEELPFGLHGFIDGINENTKWLFEHKTSSRYWSCDDVDTDIQATAYSYAYYKIYNELPEGIRFNILKKNKKFMKFQALETYRTFEDLVYFFNWAKNIYEDMRASKFEPKQTRFGFHHHACPYSSE